MITSETAMNNVASDDRWKTAKETIVRELPLKKTLSGFNKTCNDVFNNDVKIDECKTAYEKFSFRLACMYNVMTNTKGTRKSICKAIDIYNDDISSIKLFAFAPISKKYYTVLSLRKGLKFSSTYVALLLCFLVALLFVITPTKIDAALNSLLFSHHDIRVIIDNYFISGHLIGFGEVSHMTPDYNNASIKNIIVSGWFHLFNDINICISFIYSSLFILAYAFILNLINIERVHALIDLCRK